MGVRDHPVVSFARDGEAVVLGSGTGSEPILHLHGSTGLGLPPVSVAKTDRLAGDGSAVRGVRYGDREVFLPLLLRGKSQAELDEVRAGLYALLAPHRGPVEVRVQSPTMGTDRYVRGYLTDGLTGDFGDGYHGSWQKVGLTFDCPDPWWMGEQRLVEMRVAAGVKPFISDTVPFFPVVLAGSTVQGAFAVEIESDAPVRPVWQVEGPGSTLLISSGSERIYAERAFAAGQVVTFDARTGTITPDIWDSVSLDSSLFSLPPGQSTVTVAMTGATPDSVVRLVYRERYGWAI